MNLYDTPSMGTFGSKLYGETGDWLRKQKKTLANRWGAYEGQRAVEGGSNPLAHVPMWAGVGGTVAAVKGFELANLSAEDARKRAFFGEALRNQGITNKAEIKRLTQLDKVQSSGGPLGNVGRTFDPMDVNKIMAARERVTGLESMEKALSTKVGGAAVKAVEKFNSHEHAMIRQLLRANASTAEEMAKVLSGIINNPNTSPEVQAATQSLLAKLRPMSKPENVINTIKAFGTAGGTHIQNIQSAQALGMKGHNPSWITKALRYIPKFLKRSSITVDYTMQKLGMEPARAMFGRNEMEKLRSLVPQEKQSPVLRHAQAVADKTKSPFNQSNPEHWGELSRQMGRKTISSEDLDALSAEWGSKEEGIVGRQQSYLPPEQVAELEGHIQRKKLPFKAEDFQYDPQRRMFTTTHTGRDKYGWNPGDPGLQQFLSHDEAMEKMPTTKGGLKWDPSLSRGTRAAAHIGDRALQAGGMTLLTTKNPFAAAIAAAGGAALGSGENIYGTLANDENPRVPILDDALDFGGKYTKPFSTLYKTTNPEAR